MNNQEELSQYKFNIDHRSNRIQLEIWMFLIDNLNAYQRALSEFMKDDNIVEVSTRIVSRKGVNIGKYAKVPSAFIVTKQVKLPSGKKYKTLIFSMHDCFNRTAYKKERAKVIEYFANLLNFNSLRGYKINSLF